jgi:flagellar hook-associated protein 1 FlgK
MSFYSVGLSALRNSQIGLATAGHNITNASTPGYHRQSIIQSTNFPLATGAGFIGQGAHIDTVRRAINQTLETQLLQVQAHGAQLDSYLSEITQIDNALGSSTTGLSAALDRFFTAVSAVAANPADVPARQALLSNSTGLTSQFQSLGQRFLEIRDGLDTQLQDSVTLINSYATQIANLNKQIALQSGTTAQGQVPNDLLDQREALISSLNKEVGTTTIIQNDGTATVFFGSGQPLVIQDQAFTLSASAGLDDPQHLDVSYQLGASNILIGSNNISGGRLGGLLAFRDEILDPAQNSLGRVAVGLAQAFNDQHHLGQDLAGNLGGDFFDVPAPIVQPSTVNTGTGVLTATLANVQHLTTSDYRLVITAAGGTLTRLSDNTSTAFTALQLSAGVTVDGTTITLGAGAAVGDRYLIQPTRTAAENIEVNASVTTTTIAAAAPIRTSATLANLGTGKISAGAVNSPNNKVTITFNAGLYDVVDQTTGATLATGVPAGTFAYNGWTTQISAGGAAGDVFTVENGVAQKTTTGAGSTSTITNAVVDVTPVNPNLKNPVTITFTSPTTFNVTGVGAGLPAIGLTYVPASGTAISFNGWSVKLTGAPQNGDTFTVGPNTNGTADNRNVLLLSQLQSRSTLAGGTASVENAFAQTVSLVGNKTSEIQITSEAQNTLIQQTQNAQQAVSGVNLDEEAADLLRYQQAYQAAGKMLQISTTLFDTLLSIGN